MKSSVKITVTRRNGKTIVKSDRGQVFQFGDKMLDETIIASLVFQTVYLSFKELRKVKETCELNLTLEVPNYDKMSNDRLTEERRRQGWMVVYPIVDGCSQEALFEGTKEQCKKYVSLMKEKDPKADFIVLPLWDKISSYAY